MSHFAIFHIFNVKASLLKSELILDFKDSIELINVKKLSLVVCYFDSIKSDLEFLNWFKFNGSLKSVRIKNLSLILEENLI